MLQERCRPYVVPVPPCVVAVPPGDGSPPVGVLPTAFLGEQVSCSKFIAHLL